MYLVGINDREGYHGWAVYEESPTDAVKTAMEYYTVETDRTFDIEVNYINEKDPKELLITCTNLVRQDRKVLAIKIAKYAFGCTLRFAKHFVDEIVSELEFRQNVEKHR